VRTPPTRSADRAAGPISRLTRASLATAIGFLTVPVFVLVPAYADDGATPSDSVAAATTDAPGDAPGGDPAGAAGDPPAAPAESSPPDTPEADPEPGPAPQAQEPPAPEQAPAPTAAKESEPEADAAPGDSAAADVAPAVAPPTDEDPEKKVVVCKWVATPETGEVFSHVIINSVSALPDAFAGIFPFIFSDAQGRSRAIRYASTGEQAKDVDAAGCVGSWTLDKSVEITTGDGDALAEPGESLTYTLTLTNTSDAVDVTNAVVTDDLGDVLDNGSIVESTLQLAASGLVLSGPVLTWTVVGPVAPGATVHASYTVKIDDGQWGEVLHNVATPENGPGTCVAAGECETTTATPDVTTMVVEKQDSETGEVLPGATFALYRDDDNPMSGGSCNFPDPVTVGDATLVGSSDTDGGGQALFSDLQHGCYILVETVAPQGYDLPEIHTLGVQVDGSNFVADGRMAPIVVTDFAQGQFATLVKRQLELVDGTWVESDGTVDFGDQVKYVVGVTATGPKNFHDVKLTDFVPGYDPSDSTSTVKGTLVPGSAVCGGGLTCATSVDANQLVTWSIGDLEPAEGASISGTVEMVVTFPDPPADLELDPGVGQPATYTATLANVAALEWDEVSTPSLPEALRGAGRGRLMGTVALAELPMTHHTLLSNQVVAQASITNTIDDGGPTGGSGSGSGGNSGGASGGGSATSGGSALPQTGASAGLGELGLMALLLLSLGIVMVRRPHEE
jgi:fimbrial isopeptide formation D2 family protein/uncharacterized repeat protein (TIGR01451 family)